MELKDFEKNEPGIYLIGQTSFNPYTGERFYLLKVGSTLTSLKNRLRGYYTHNPSTWIIETKEIQKDEVLEEEYFLSGILNELSASSKIKKIDNFVFDRNVEWFCVSRKIYLAICEQGFDYLYDYNEKLVKEISEWA